MGKQVCTAVFINFALLRQQTKNESITQLAIAEAILAVLMVELFSFELVNSQDGIPWRLKPNFLSESLLSPSSTKTSMSASSNSVTVNVLALLQSYRLDFE